MKCLILDQHPAWFVHKADNTHRRLITTPGSLAKERRMTISHTFKDLISKMVTVGRLSVRIGEDAPFTVGSLIARRPDLDVAIHIADAWTAAAIAADPDLQLGEAYMDERLEIEAGSLWSLMELIGRNGVRRPQMGLMTSLKRSLAGFMATNTPERSRRNVAHHYDLSEEFYRLFLDDDMQYSCAYFSRPGMTLEEAQVAKKAHIAAKLELRDGQRILDIGCGWGGLALSLAKVADVELVGVTLSREQLRFARARAVAEGLADRVRFELIDYRSVAGPFDRIVSVGMFEHVGRSEFDTYFGAIQRLLKPGGLALVHSIGRKDPGPGVNPWIERHVFPGGYIPAASQALDAIERSGLWTTDMEVLRTHYAETLRHWRERVERQRREIEHLYDARFYRMWTFYLALCEMGFRYNGLMVMQLQIAADSDALPITRDYLSVEETHIAHRLHAVDHAPLALVAEVA
jgi:cyclopropane-fatty-acyl-phospholipid synthase